MNVLGLGEHYAAGEPIPEELAEEEKLLMAVNELKRINADAELRQLLELRAKEAHDRATALAEARERGIEEGIQKGIERGIERGIEKGIEKGIERGIEKGPGRNGWPLPEECSPEDWKRLLSPKPPAFPSKRSTACWPARSSTTSTCPRGMEPANRSGIS